MLQTIIDRERTISQFVAKVPHLPHFRLSEYFLFTKSLYCYFPWGIDIDSSQNVYVCDYMSCYVQRYDQNGNHLTPWGGQGNQQGKLLFPRGLAADTSGNIYVSDGCHNTVSYGATTYSPFDRVQKFSPNGTVLASVGAGLGSGNTQFKSSMGVACDQAGNVYVADYGNKRVQKFDSNLHYIATLGSGQLTGPIDVACDSAGNVYIADENDSILKLNPNGGLVTSWGGPGTGNGQFNKPSGISVDSAGGVYVVDGGNNRIQRFDSNGKWLTTWGTYGSADGQFDWPAGVATGSSGLVFVSDFNNHRIEEFKKFFRFIVVR